jgi:hypothetical protein
MQYPRYSKECRRLSKFAHKLGVSGVVHKTYSSQAGPNKGTVSQFAIDQGNTSSMLGQSRIQARPAIVRMSPYSEDKVNRILATIGTNKQ